MSASAPPSIVQAVYIASTIYFTQMDSALEGVLYVDDPGCALDDEYPDHVEAQGVEVGFSFGEVLFGQGADGGLFAWVDGLKDSRVYVSFLSVARIYKGTRQQRWVQRTKSCR